LLANSFIFSSSSRSIAANRDTGVDDDDGDGAFLFVTGDEGEAALPFFFLNSKFACFISSNDFFSSCTRADVLRAPFCSSPASSSYEEEEEEEEDNFTFKAFNSASAATASVSARCTAIDASSTRSSKSFDDQGDDEDDDEDDEDDEDDAFAFAFATFPLPPRRPALQHTFSRINALSLRFLFEDHLLSLAEDAAALPGKERRIFCPAAAADDDILLLLLLWSKSKCC
tara:strand:+ start:207 stop:890 length:684 start_codon:yes stop_codon:yes gene_type:complete